MCAGGRLPKFEIFCVITCGLTTHKISIAAPAEGPFIHYNKENYVAGRLEGWGDIFRDLVRSKLAIMPMSAFSGQENVTEQRVTKFSTDCLRGVVAANNITLEG